MIGHAEARFTVSANRYAHAVHFSLGDQARYSDAYFDLLPGEGRTVTVAGVSSSDLDALKAFSVLPG